MLSQLFLISTLLLVGITTIAIGAPVAETIESIKAVKIHQMGSGNLTLNRRFVNGYPGLPQCTDPQFPDLIYSECKGPTTILATCDFPGNLGSSVECITQCPPKTFCKNFIANKPPPKYVGFALCVNEEDIKKFDNNGKDGVFCKTYTLEDADGTATISMTIVDGSSNPIQVRGVSYKTGNQSGSRQNTSGFSTIVDALKNQPITVCMSIAIAGLQLFDTFTYFSGSISS